jgi:hypothetical protein
MGWSIGGLKVYRWVKKLLLGICCLKPLALVDFHLYSAPVLRPELRDETQTRPYEGLTVVYILGGQCVFFRNHIQMFLLLSLKTIIVQNSRIFVVP